MEKKSVSLFVRNMLVWLDVVIAVNAIARSPKFCDFYTDRIFRFLTEPLCRLTGWASVSLGEGAIVLAIIFLLTTLLFAFLLIFLRKKKRYKAFAVKYIKSFTAFFLVVATIMTLNCSIPYGCSTIYLNDKQPGDYSFYELLDLYNDLAETCNDLSLKVERDENGDAVYHAEEGQTVSPLLIIESEKVMHNLSKEYPRLGGYYPLPKALKGSIFMFLSGVIGVYFPFTMESNYSSYLAQLHFPATICHEYSHLKGYMYEDEANFIGFLACMKSDDDFVRYSGYLNALVYVAGDVSAAIRDPDYRAVFDERAVYVSELVQNDSYSYTDESLQRAMELAGIIEDSTGVTEDEMRETSDKFSDAYAEYHNTTINYDEVTYRLLQYYDNPAAEKEKLQADSYVESEYPVCGDEFCRTEEANP